MSILKNHVKEKIKIWWEFIKLNTFNKEDYNAIYKDLQSVLTELKNFKKISFNISYKKVNGQFTFDKELIPDSIKGKAGIYIIEACDRNIIKLLTSKWDEYKAIMKTVPQRNKDNKDTKFIYVGKNESNLKNRLSQHLDTVKTTYALKLKNFYESYEGDFEHKFKVTCYCYVDSSKKCPRNVRMLIRAIEGYYYNEMKPLIGSSK